MIIAKTNARFAMFDPITFPKAKSGNPETAAWMLTISSGAEVAKETTVIPITNREIFNPKDIATADFINQSPPFKRRIKPTTIAINSIIKFSARYNLLPKANIFFLVLK